MLYCTCGKPNPIGSNFCCRCGKSFNTTASAPPETPSRLRPRRDSADAQTDGDDDDDASADMNYVPRINKIEVEELQNDPGVTRVSLDALLAEGEARRKQQQGDKKDTP